MSWIFYNCNSLSGYINIYSNNVTNAVSCFLNSKLEKYIRVYTNTITYSSFYHAMNNSTTSKLWNATLVTF